LEHLSAAFWLSLVQRSSLTAVGARGSLLLDHFHARWITFTLSKTPTQEAAAELLDLPFSTYRYHLTNGIKRITEWLWQRELYGLKE